MTNQMNNRTSKPASTINTAVSVSVKTLLLASIFVAAPSLADRPAMASLQVQTQAETPVPIHQNETSNRPSVPASSVELMMQRQAATSGTVLQNLPAKEMQPGETISIQTLDEPRRGATMDKVQNEFGAPLSSTPSVGKPPISSWIYNDRIVYFEYSHVIHVVTR